MASGAALDHRALEQLRDLLALEVEERVDRGDCGCGCRTPLPVPRGRRRYINERHRQRAYRQRLEREAEALGVPDRLSHKSLNASIPTSDRHADAQTRPAPRQRRRSRPRPGVTVYLPTPADAERLLDAMCGDHVDDLREVVTAALERRRARS